MKRKTSKKTEKLDEDKQTRLKEDLSPREKRQNLWENRMNTWKRRFIDLSYVCQQLADGCKLCKTEISLAHYEDETMIGLDSILHITFIISSNEIKIFDWLIRIRHLERYC